MDSRYGAFSIPRRPVASAASPLGPPPPYSALPERTPPLPPRLRTSKSVAQLDERHRAPPPPERPPPSPLCKEKQATTLPTGFVFHNAAAWNAQPLLAERPVRRAKSSVDLRRPQTSAADSVTKPESSWKRALDEAQYLAGGLISSPVESTRHHSVIRHSGALVWYRGPETAVTLTILSDEPLSPTRSLWLQQKGYSGSVGMSLKAMVGTTNDWLDVTPAAQAQAAHVPANEERGIQRDLKRFASKATGRLKSHLPRETYMVRIPAAAQDGYFRIVLCPTRDGKKVLVGSPVFRLASTSADVSVLRGAGLRSMPLEVGVKVASAVASTYVTAATGAAAGAARIGAGRVTSAAAKKVAQKAYRGCARAGVHDAVQDSWLRSSTARYERAVSSALMEPTVGVIVGAGAEGPAPPFPIKFSGHVVRGTGYTRARYGFPTANLAGAPAELTMRMTGSFAAWVRQVRADEGDPAWYEAVVRIGPAENGAPSIVQKNDVAVHILHELEDTDLCGATLQVLLMGFLRPLGVADAAGGDVDGDLQRHADDLLTTLATLVREQWQPEPTVERIRARKGERSWRERLDGVTGTVAARVDRVPMHRAGIRSEAGALRDASLGNGGLWIQR
ncbi:and NB-ARC domain [Cordyceps militaris]|uniref:Riboflavin kinase n=1 Tax=Cordyceps militaris TaxID=73501 RepID=A0A2H4SPG1_CORMI|nr:and NB-ARC domain [Cordyceps militaris]